jgi:four helix bundle protein
MALLHYRELVVWQKGVALVTDVYHSTASFPKQELFGLTSQIRRSAASVPANIAEGQGRSTRGEFKLFLGHARGSLYELETHLIVARNIHYLPEKECSELVARVHEVGRLLNGLVKSLEGPRATKEN